MKSVTVKTTIKRPIEEVFDYVADSRNDVHWSPGVGECELIEGDGPGEGAVYRIQQFEGPGKFRETQLRTTACERPSHLEWRMDGDAVDYHSRIDFTDRGGKTHWRQTNTVTIGGGGANQLVWFLGANVMLRLQLRNVRKLLESNA